MKTYLKLWCALLCILYTANNLTAQKVSIDEIKKECSGLAFDKRVRLSVSSFTVATPTAQGKFGDELAQMLTTALQGVDCFNVLLSLKDIGNATDEINFNKTGSTDQNASIQGGKMKGAQVIVMGKITDYFPGTSSNGSLGTGKAKIGFTIQLVNPQTREIIDSKPINVQGKTFIGIGGTSNKSLADAMEKGIFQAVEFIAESKDKMPMPESGANAAASSITEINVLNTDYTKFKFLIDILSTKGKVLEKSISNGNGYIKLDHAGTTTDQLVDLIDSKANTKFNIKDFTNNGITLQAK
ncbi:MAG TPA: CsgG/HfaB family protein [Panacibacter sp.]|nr:CsgG/HfaB family protein [Panacibacter sp.]